MVHDAVRRSSSQEGEEETYRIQNRPLEPGLVICRDSEEMDLNRT